MLERGPVPPVDVVIVRYGADELLAGCLRSLESSADLLGQVVVVDNGPAPLAPAAMPSGMPVLLLTPPANLGFGAGCNRGAAEGSSPVILFLNPDAAIGREVIQRAGWLVGAAGGPAVLGPRLVDAKMRTMPSCGRLPSFRWETYEKLLKFLHWRVLEAAVRDRDRVDRVEWVAGACAFARREVYEAVGGFDPAFFLYFEDKDLCARVREAGHEVRFMWDPPVWHQGAGSGDAKVDASCFRAYRQSQLRYYRKHRPRAELALLRLYLRAMAWWMERRSAAPPRLGAILREVVAHDGA